MPHPKVTPRKPFYRDAGFAVLRTPLLPFDDFARWGERAIASFNVNDRLGESEETKRVITSLETLRDFIEDRAFLDAVSIASPSLFHAISNWKSQKGKPEFARLEQSLVRYFTRASYRTTPFGLFAGCSLMTVGDSTVLNLCPREKYTRKSRVDMDHVAELTRVIAEDIEARRRLLLYSNSTCVRVGPRLHYVEISYAGRRRQYALTAAQLTDEIAAVLANAVEGATFADLARPLSQDGFENDEIDAFLMQLIDAQLLVPKIEPQLTGTDALSGLAADLETASYGADISAALRATTEKLADLDGKGVGVAEAEYRAALAPLLGLPVPIDESKILQVDLFKPTPSLSLSKSVIGEIVDAAETLLALDVRLDRLSAFVSRFEERYETCEVPLLEALDTEIGIGFPEPESNDRLVRQYLERARPRDLHLAELRSRAAQARSLSVELDDSELRRLLPRRPPTFADSVAAMVTLCASSTERIQGGDYQVLINSVVGPSGARLLGRFAHLDSHFTLALQDYVRAEELLQPDVCYAEIVHLPQGRIGNIAARPQLRELEIEYLGRSGAKEARTISVSDLALSVRNGRLTIRSTSLDREIRPRLSCAHNFSASRELPVYRFLAAFQEHGVTGSSSWSWGNHTYAPFLPRVTRGRIIFSRARWTVGGEEIRQLTSGSQRATHMAFERWRAAKILPRFVVLADSDNRMLIDSANPNSVDALMRLLKGRSMALLEEMLPTPDSLCVSSAEGRFTNEIVVPLLRAEAQPDRPRLENQSIPSSQLRSEATAAARRHPPGREWVYAKLYCGKGTGDHVIRTVVKAVVDVATSEHLMDRWFFLRYNDPDFHIRLRVHGASHRMPRVMQLIAEACAPGIATGELSRLVFDTYLPEIERYGGAKSIALAEMVFCADSIAALAALTYDHESTGESPPDREMLALAGLERYFTDAGLDLAQRIALLERRLGAPSANARRARSTLFRARRAAIGQTIARVRAVPSTASFGGAFDGRTATVREILAELRRLESQQQLLMPVESMLLSFCHMWINRVSASASDIETNLYDFLNRHYLSERARATASEPARVV